MDNSLARKPFYTAHRRGATAVDPTNLGDLLTQRGRGAIDAHGYDSLHGFVVLAGTTPSITFIPYEIARYLDADDVVQEVLIPRGSSIGPLSNGDVFSFDTPGGGRWLLRVSAVGGTVTKGEIYIAGGLRANEGSI